MLSLFNPLSPMNWKCQAAVQDGLNHAPMTHPAPSCHLPPSALHLPPTFSHTGPSPSLSFWKLWGAWRTWLAHQLSRR